jgi:hypothetical protein
LHGAAGFFRGGEIVSGGTAGAAYGRRNNPVALLSHQEHGGLLEQSALGVLSG